MKFKNTVIIVIILVLFMTSCATNMDNTEAKDGKLKIYTSFYAMYDFTKMICGDKADVYMLVPVGSEPHEWEPTSKDMIGMMDADMIVYNGAGLEHWVDTVRDSLHNDNIKYVEASSGIEKDRTENDNFSDVTDPHVWLNPNNASIELRNIKDVLLEIDPLNKEYYEYNYNSVLGQIEALDKAYKDILKGLTSSDIIVAHEAYGYLCKAYGLNQIAIEGISTDSEPTPSRMAEIISYINENNIKYIFMEELTNSKSVTAISKETDAKILMLNPYEGITEQDEKDGADYFSVMYKNLESLKEALGVE